MCSTVISSSSSTKAKRKEILQHTFPALSDSVSKGDGSFLRTDSGSHRAVLWTGVTRGADRAVSAPPESQRESRRVAGDSAKSQHSLRRLVPSAGFFSFFFFETVPMEAGLSPCSWNFLQAQSSRAGRGRQSRDPQGEFAASPTCREPRFFWLWVFAPVFFFFWTPTCTKLTSWDDMGTVRIQSAFNNVIKKNKKKNRRACDVTQRAVLDIAWGNILMSRCDRGQRTRTKIKFESSGPVLWIP